MDINVNVHILRLSNILFLYRNRDRVNPIVRGGGKIPGINLLMDLANGTFDITQIPQMVNDAMFGGDTAFLIASQMICAIFVIFVVSLPMVMAKVKPANMVLMDVLVLGALTAIGWVDGYIFLLVILVTALFMARMGADFMAGVK